MILTICKELKPNCLLISCCTKLCPEIKDHVNKRFDEWIKTKHMCPVCDSNDKVDYRIQETYAEKLYPIELMIHCKECDSFIFVYFRTNDTDVFKSAIFDDYKNKVIFSSDIKTCDYDLLRFGVTRHDHIKRAIEMANYSIEYRNKKWLAEAPCIDCIDISEI